MEYHFTKTTDISDQQFKGILVLFNTIFSRSLSLEELRSQYLCTELGFSYHSFFTERDRVVAHHAAFPVYYMVSGTRVLAYYTGSTMVDKEYRDGLTFLEMIKKLDLNMKCLGYAFGFGFPNDLSYKVFTKLKLSREIGRMHVYCLPYRIGGIKRALRFLNPLSMFFCRFYVWLHRFGGNKIEKKYLIHKIDDSYNEFRYRRVGQEYHRIQYDNVEFYYCIKAHEGIRTAFIIDVRNKSQKSFQRAVRYVLYHLHKEFDLLLYIGNLEGIGSTGLIRIPQRFEPKHFYVTGGIVEKSLIEESLFFDIHNWDLNLSNYDLI